MKTKLFIDDGNDTVLAEALKKYNNAFMEELPMVAEPHSFSKKFEKRMSQLLRANKKFGGRRWLERSVRYATGFAAMVVCLLAVNTISIHAFHINLWEIVVDSTGDLINLKFKNGEKENIDIPKEGGTHFKIANIPNGYSQADYYTSEELVVQVLQSNNGTITYTEGLLTESADVNAYKGEQETETIGAKEVTFIYGENNITALFTDVKYYHIVEIQGQDANKKTVAEIIKGLEEQ